MSQKGPKTLYGSKKKKKTPVVYIPSCVLSFERTPVIMQLLERNQRKIPGCRDV